MKRLWSLFALVVFFVALTACGSKSTAPTSGITVSPATSSIKTGETVQFTFTSSGSTTVTSVNWQVNGVAGGDLTNGTITPLGFYIAPGTVPTKNPITVTAVSSVDTTISGAAAVTISAGTPVAISMLPVSASVGTGQTSQFTATVSNTANTAVNWYVNDNLGGDPLHGSINSAGMYTAPSTVPADAVTVKAVAAADTTKSATAAITITPFRFVSITASSDVQPLLAGSTRTFTASVNGNPANVTWRLTCASAAPDACGTVTSTGASTAQYAAPRTPPPGGDVTVTARTTDNSANPGGALVSIAFGNGSLNGRYAFSLAGQKATNEFAAVGSISFDGLGNVSSAIEDVSAGPQITFNAGTYNVGTDGRGAVTLQQKSGGTVTLEKVFQIALVSHTHIFMNEFEASETATGALDEQTPADFAHAAVAGNYALAAAGRDVTSADDALAMAGAFVADGSGVFTSGVLDSNDGGDVQSHSALPAGTYSVPDAATGRGILQLATTLGGHNFVYYVVNGSRLKLLQTDASMIAIGDLVKQAGTGYTSNSMKGTLVFALAGSSAGRALGEGGLMVMDGAGNAGNGTMDINAYGNVSTGSLSGTYDVPDASHGRAAMALTVGGVTRHYVCYPQAAGRWNFLETGPDVAAGTAFLQTGDSFTHASILGDFALSLAGVELTGGTGGLGVVGRVTPNGVAALSGLIDFNGNGVLAGGTSLEGAYTVASPNGRGAATLQTGIAGFRSASYSIYVVDSNTVLLLESDSDRVLTGIMQKQP